MPSITPISSAPVSTIYDAPDVRIKLASASDILGFVADHTLRLGYVAKEAIHLTTVLEAGATYLLQEAIDFDPKVHGALELGTQVSETIQFGTALGFAARILASDGLTLEGNSDYAVLRILVASEALRLSAGVGTTLEVAGTL